MCFKVTMTWPYKVWKNLVISSSSEVLIVSVWKLCLNVFFIYIHASSFKGIVHPKINPKIVIIFLHPCKTCMTIYSVEKKDIFKKVSNDTVLVPLDLHCMDKNTVEGSVKCNCLVISILENNVSQKKVSHAGFNDMVVSKWWQNFHF